MFVGKHEKWTNRPSWISSDHIISRTHTAEKGSGEVDENGRNIVAAGTVYPANDATAIGLVMDDVDVTENNQPVGIMVEGYVYGERLPEPISEEAELTEIKVEEYNATEDTP